MVSARSSVVILGFVLVAYTAKSSVAASTSLRAVNATTVHLGGIFGNIEDALRPRGVKEQESRIIGGQSAGATEFPFYCDIRIKSGTLQSTHPCKANHGRDVLKNHWCGATLLPGGKHVLTAAHCLQGNFGSSVLASGEIWCSAHSNDNCLGEDSAIVRQPVSIDLANEKYDAAIITLDQVIDTIPITDFLYCNQDQDFPAQRKYAMTTIGMGTITEPSAYTNPSSLQKVTLFYRPHDECLQTYSIDEEVVLCADDFDSSTVRNACRGDSGAPIFADGLHLGIDSFGNSDCSLPTGFCRSSSICGWACSFDPSFCAGPGVQDKGSSEGEDPTGGDRADTTCRNEEGSFSYLNRRNRQKRTTCANIKTRVDRNIQRKPNQIPARVCSRTPVFAEKCPSLCDRECIV